ncbi:MAG TPA: FAD-linked oxidase C-terminal domain-containing protein [Candidatus Dormibacteraeota bacterium]
MLDRRVIRDLEGQVDAPQVYTRPADLAAYAYDAWGASGERHLPDAVVFPGSTDEVAGVVQVAAYHGVPVVPRGAGTGYAAGAAPCQGGIVLSLTRMNRILGVERDGQRLFAEAGAITKAVHAAAQRTGLFYPPDPGSSSTCTIGGNVACNAAGPHTLRYGVTADYVAGLTAVLADGKVLRLGEGGDRSRGALLALLAGSEGTLAVITQVLLRLLPAPAARVTLAARFSSMARAATSVAEVSAAGVVPAALEFLDAGALDAVRRAGGGDLGGHAAALVIFEVEGSAAAVANEAEAVLRAASSAGADSVEAATTPAEADRLWLARKAVSAAVAKVMIGKVNEDVVVPRDRIAELVDFTHVIGERHQLPVVNFGHLGDGNLHATFLIDPRIAGERQRADAAAGELFERVLAMGGSLSGEHGVGQAKLGFVEQQLGPGGVALMRRVKDAIDPHGTLNPGKKIPPLGVAEAEPAAVAAAS